jgi:5'-nucleotidase
MYSGTVAAAIEGAILGIPSIAVSIAAHRDFSFQAAAEFTVALAGRVLEQGMPLDTLLNVNVPPLPAHELKGCRLTRQGKRRYSEAIVERVDPRGKKYYWIGGDDLGFVHEEGTDCVAVHEGFISVTPLHIDLTHYQSFQEIQALMLPWP